MTDSAKDTTEAFGLPIKTATLVLWVAILGGVALFANQTWLQDESAADSALAGTNESSLERLPLASATQMAAHAPDESQSLDMWSLDWKKVGRDAREGVASIRPIEVNDEADMMPFFRELVALEAGKASEPVRIVHYGDSILTTDELSGQIRRRLQQQFGDGGHGFMLLGKPWNWYHHRDMRHGARGMWDIKTLTSQKIRSGLYGLGGVGFETRQPKARVWVSGDQKSQYASKVAIFDISYLERPKGGSFDIFVDGEYVNTVNTASPKKQIQHYLLEINPKVARLEIKATGNGPIRVYGVVMESGENGVVYDSLAINGVRASSFLGYDASHLQSELKRRKASLIVLMLGTNESHNDHLVLSSYRKSLESVLRMMRNGAPAASCLLVGPLDQARRNTKGRLVPKEMPARLNALQRKVAFEQGCGFFDAYTAMGGKGSMIRWYRTGFGSGDFIHPTEYGSRRVGDWIAEALLKGYRDYQNRREGRTIEPEGALASSTSLEEYSGI